MEEFTADARRLFSNTLKLLADFIIHLAIGGKQEFQFAGEGVNALVDECIVRDAFHRFPFIGGKKGRRGIRPYQ